MHLAKSSRRDILRTSPFLAATALCPGLFAEELEALRQTSAMTEGPFYPTDLPLDTDNDLIVLNDRVTPAVGQITHVSGRVLSKAGLPVRNAFVEIWQVDNEGVYRHPDARGADGLDPNFQSYGRFLTGIDGRYYFRTIRPSPYGPRAPHIHFGISCKGKRIFTSQLMVEGDEKNPSDFLLNRIKEPEARATLLREFKPVPGSKLDELAVEFDIVLGHTVEELDDGGLYGVGKSLVSRGEMEAVQRR